MATAHPKDLDESDLIGKSSAGADNRRRYPRKTARWSAVVQNTRKEYFHGHTINVSENGMQISLPCSFAKDEQLFISVSAFNRGTSLTIKAISQVCHCAVSGSHFNIGVQFVRIDPRSTAFLASYTAVTEQD